METIQQQPQAQERPPRTTLEMKKEAAFISVLGSLQSRIEGQERSNQIFLDGREREIDGVAGCVIANQQELVKAVEDVLSGIGKTDYFQEEQAAKMLAIAEELEKVSRVYADILSKFPEEAKKLENFFPGLSAMSEQGRDRWYGKKS